MEALTNEILYQKSPQELTALLYEGMLENLEASIEDIEQKDYISANKKLQRANDILHRLGIGLKYEAGSIAEQLDTLYNFLADQLILANIKKDIEIIKKAAEITEVLSKAWNDAIKLKPTSLQTNLSRKVSAYENSIMRTNN
jgi:flagellar secretion chaperone FliS